MIKEQSFEPSSRYDFDFDECNYKKGWCQIDTTEDAPYYGNWFNAKELKATHYCEGDVTRVTCETEDELAEYIADWIKWSYDIGYNARIDTFGIKEAVWFLERHNLSEYA